jgi:hypothetical protein
LVTQLGKVRGASLEGKERERERCSAVEVGSSPTVPLGNGRLP